MSDTATRKPLFWVGSSLDDLRGFPEAVRRVMGFALGLAQGGGKHVDAKTLKGFGGAGVLEVVADDDGSTYRAVYTVRVTEAVYVLHVFQKKSRRAVKTSRQDIGMVRKRFRRAEEHYRSRSQGAGGGTSG